MTVSVLVVVLGDIGHSPRMRQHVQELVRNGYDVDCLAYRGTCLLLGRQSSSLFCCMAMIESTFSDSLTSNCRFHFHPLPILSSSQGLRGPFLWLYILFKVLHQIFWIFWICLFRLYSPPKFILNQVILQAPCRFFVRVTLTAFMAHHVHGMDCSNGARVLMTVAASV